MPILYLWILGMFMTSLILRYSATEIKDKLIKEKALVWAILLWPFFLAAYFITALENLAKGK